MRKVFFAGPLPPPVHGFAVINGHMLAGLRNSGAAVQVFDLAPRSLLAPLLKWFSFLAATFRPMAGGGKTLYLPISGGIRQLVDLAFAVPAKLLGFRLFVHHHTFAYLNAKPWFARLALWILKDAIHVVLCPVMGQRLCALYNIAGERVRVLSNSAFLDLEVGQPVDASELQLDLTLGFLSNITAEKGIFIFFDALDALLAKKIPFNALIAGPVSSEIKMQFDARLACTADVRHVGAVYGETKDQFFNELDVLLFPSIANEAEPVTLWEAMAHEVPIIALQRGCIQGIVPNDVGRVVFESNAFANAVVEEVVAMRQTPGLLTQRRKAARSHFELCRQQSKQTLETLIDEMTSGTSEVQSK